MGERKRDWSALFNEAMRQWRAAHPRATFKEIDTQVSEEMAQVRAKIMKTWFMKVPAGNGGGEKRQNGRSVQYVAQR
jgi:FMN-dependent NADH-azoreductase